MKKKSILIGIAFLTFILIVSLIKKSYPLGSVVKDYSRKIKTSYGDVFNV